MLQRISERGYWVFIGNYSTVFYVGDRGVLLLDPLGTDKSDALLAAVRTVTDKPVTMVVYSHNHADHIGGIGTFIQDAGRQGNQLEIVASRATADKQRFLGSGLPAPTRILAGPEDRIQFEDAELSMIRFERGGHTDDSAMWILPEEGILYVSDYLNPDQIPYHNFGGAESYVYYKQNIKAIADTDWTVLVTGHGNVGRRGDVDFLLQYMDDIEEAVESATSRIDWSAVLADGSNNHEALMHAMYVQLGELVKDQLRPRYGDYYGFEASVPYQAQAVALALEAYR